jgi:hypothetical protein
MSEKEAITILKTVRKALPKDRELIDSCSPRDIGRNIADAFACAF